MLFSIVRLLRLASLVICVIVIASFAIFVVNQSKSASAHQTQEIVSGNSTVKTVLALLIYGFALSYLARVIRVRV